MTHVHVISEDELAVATRLAEQTLALFAGRPGYYNNSVNSHLRGKLGEIAVSAFLRLNGVETDDLWKDVERISAADVILAGRLRADVKTWDVRYWAEYGRCISVKQLPRLQTKADAIIWCTSESVIAAGMKVTLEGWNTLKEVKLANRRYTGPSGRRQVYNYQLEPESVRRIATILTADWGRDSSHGPEL